MWWMKRRRVFGDESRSFNKHILMFFFEWKSYDHLVQTCFGSIDSSLPNTSGIPATTYVNISMAWTVGWTTIDKERAWWKAAGWWWWWWWWRRRRRRRRTVHAFEWFWCHFLGGLRELAEVSPWIYKQEPKKRKPLASLGLFFCFDGWLFDIDIRLNVYFTLVGISKVGHGWDLQNT